MIPPRFGVPMGLLFAPLIACKLPKRPRRSSPAPQALSPDLSPLEVGDKLFRGEVGPEAVQAWLRDRPHPPAPTVAPSPEPPRVPPERCPSPTVAPHETRAQRRERERLERDLGLGRRQPS